VPLRNRFASHLCSSWWHLSCALTQHDNRSRKRPFTDEEARIILRHNQWDHLLYRLAVVLYKQQRDIIAEITQSKQQVG
jgi:hypothetical protein